VALVRTQEKADLVKKAFPHVRIVLGDLDNADLLKEEASKADIVLRELGTAVVEPGVRPTHSLQMPPTLQTTKAQPKPSPLVFLLATPRATRDTGCILAARAF